MRPVNVLIVGEHLFNRYFLKDRTNYIGSLNTVKEKDLFVELSRLSNVEIVVLSILKNGRLTIDVAEKIKVLFPHILIAGLVDQPTSEQFLTICRSNIDDVLPIPVSDIDWEESVRRLLSKQIKKEQSGIWKKFIEYIMSLFSIKNIKHNPILREKKTEEIDTPLEVNEVGNRNMQEVKEGGNTNSLISVENSNNIRRPRMQNGNSAEALDHIKEVSSSIHENGKQENVIKLEIFSLGNTQILLNGKPVPFQGRKCLSIFLYLALHYPKPVSRREIINKFWHRGTDESARNSLNVYMTKMRKTLKATEEGSEYIIYRKGKYLFDPALKVLVDVQRFSENYDRGIRLESLGRSKEAKTYFEKAERLYKGEFFVEHEGWDWVDEESGHVRERYLYILDRLSNYYSNNGAPQEAINYCHTILQYDKCREEIHRRLMRSYYRIGKRHLAIRQYYECVKVLAEEFNVGPTEETLILHEKIISN